MRRMSAIAEVKAREEDESADAYLRRRVYQTARTIGASAAIKFA